MSRVGIAFADLRSDPQVAPLVSAARTVRFGRADGSVGEPLVDLPVGSQRMPVWTGPVRADLGREDGDLSTADWWWLGVHGGAGVSTLAATVAGGWDANRHWPDPANGGPRAVVLVGRSSAQGLRGLRAALRQHAAGGAPAGLHPLGVVVVADRPGRSPRHLVREIRMLRGIAPAVWQVPWLAELLETADPERLPLPPALHDLDRDLRCLRSTR